MSNPTAGAPASPGAKFRAALAAESPLQVIGAINANHALLAKRAGYRAIYLSGGGVAAGSLGLPDLGINTLDDVLTDVRRITDVCDLPLLVDIDTGFGPSAFNIARTVKIADQVRRGRLPHRRPGRRQALRPPSRQGNRHRCRKWSTASRPRSMPRPIRNFFIIARTDAIAVEGVDAAIERAVACVEAGADGIFAEAAYDLRHVPAVRRRGEGAGAGQHHRVRRDAAVHRRRTGVASAWPSCCIRCRRSAP